MAGFAPAYYHESNNEWLNDLVSDIIEPNNRAQNRAHSQSRDDDYVEVLGSDSGRASTATPDGRFGRRSRLHGRISPQSLRTDSRLSRGTKRSSSRLAQAENIQNARHTMASPWQDRDITSVMEEGPGVVSLNPFVDEPSSPMPDAQGRMGSPASFRTEHWSPTIIPSEPDSALTRGKTPYSIPSRTSSRKVTSSATSGRKTRTSLGRTMSQKRLSDLYASPLGKSRTESVSGLGRGFAPHPGVRPLEARKVLGEAAGPSEDDQDHEYPGPLALFLIITGLCLSVFIISVDRNIVTTAIPQITATFHSYDDIGWYGSAYFLTASAFQPLYGRIYTSFDTRWTFLFALAIFELGSLLGAVSPNSPVLILGRAVQGFGSAGLLTGAFVVSTHSVRMQARPVLFAVVGILYGVGALAGPLLGGVFTDLLTWRWAFWINLPIGAVTFVGVFFFFKPRKAKTHRPPWIKRILHLDLIGNAILLGAMVQLFLALQLSETSGSWSSAPVIGLLCGFGVTILIFVGWLFFKGDSALLPIKIISQRTVAASCGAAFFIYAALLMHAYYLPIWFQAIQGDSALHSGVNMIPYMVANALFSLMAGVFVSKNGLFAPPAITGCAIGTIGSGLLATIGPTTSTSKWIGFEILISAGLGMAIQQGFSAVQTALPLEQVPIGTAAVVACQSLGGAIFVSVGNTLLQNHLLNESNANTIPGVDIRAVFEQGATMFRSFVPADDLPALITLYNDSLRAVFIAAVPLCGVAFLSSLCMEWRSVRREDVKDKFVENAEKTGIDEKV